MNIDIVRNNFSQFYDGVELRVKTNETTITHDISKKELVDFAYSLLDVAYDLLSKHGDAKYESGMDEISEAMTSISDA